MKKNRHVFFVFFFRFREKKNFIEIFYVKSRLRISYLGNVDYDLRSIVLLIGQFRCLWKQWIVQVLKLYPQVPGIGQFRCLWKQWIVQVQKLFPQVPWTLLWSIQSSLRFVQVAIRLTKGSWWCSTDDCAQLVCTSPDYLKCHNDSQSNQPFSKWSKQGFQGRPNGRNGNSLSSYNDWRLEKETTWLLTV